MFKTIEWTEAGIRMLDQRLLPGEETYLTLHTPEEVAAAIRDMVIRGAPAIGVAAAMGIALGFKPGEGDRSADVNQKFAALADLFAATRPTAVNLFWAIERMRRHFTASKGDRSSLPGAMREEALAILREDIEANRSLGRHQILQSHCPPVRPDTYVKNH